MEHTHHWELKYPPLPKSVDFGLVDALVEPVVSYLKPPAPIVDPSQVTPGDCVVDLTNDDEK